MSKMLKNMMKKKAQAKIEEINESDYSEEEMDSMYS